MIDFLIGKIQAKLFFNHFTVDQAFDFIFRCFICLIDKTLHKIISTRIDPVGFRFCLRIILRTIHKVYDIPWAVDIRFPKTVAIVPVFHFREAFFQLIIRKQLFHFRIRKPKLLIETRICDRQDFKVVKPRKDTLFRHTKTACQDRKSECVIRL